MKNKEFARKLKKKLILRALLFCGILLGINTYAWFIFITKVDTEITASVASWDIKFLDDDTLIKDLNINLTKIQPDMEDYVRELSIVNGSEVRANLNCKIESITILGHEYTYEESDEDTVNAYSKLTGEFPFVVSISDFNRTLEIGERIGFSVSVTWPYENVNDYYLVNDLFNYNESIDYFSLSGDNYNKLDSVSEDNFDTLRNNNLYVNSDDADSFYGSMCGKYQAENDDPCLKVRLKLVVDQALN